MSPSNVVANTNPSCNNNNNYMEHRVSKMDTLAGVAIKYGVEVADIKRLNGLATDLQMFALKTLKIPLPGRHPPSNGSAASSGTEKPLPHLGHYNLLETFQSRRLKPPQQKGSSAMSTLQKYYNLPEAKSTANGHGTEMSLYRRGSLDLLNEVLLPKASQISDRHPNDCHKSRNTLVNGFRSVNGANTECIPLSEAGNVESEKSNEKSVRRRSIVEADSRGSTPDWLWKDEYGSGSSGTGKSLAMRPKSANRITTMAIEPDSVWLNSILGGVGDTIISDGPAVVHKSLSTPNLQDQENDNSSVWPVSWSLKPDLQTFSTVAITRPIFDGLPLPKPIRCKAALD